MASTFEKFEKFIRGSFPRVTEDRSNPNSPILEVIKDLSEREEFYNSSRGSTLYIISDMRQNSSILKFYDYKNRKAMPLTDDALNSGYQTIFGDNGLKAQNFDIVIYELQLQDANVAASDGVRNFWTEPQKGMLNQ